ncbi:phosphodiesterase [Anaerococcus sp. AGMB00486]|uniref:Phosphoesterase n=2 Tax=Anaerococcus TaxID=165779 RepID=A0ABX2NBR5_9FIRM|nr:MULTISPECIES: phosphodiesterase [Anaerococcus]MDY3006659.1 phosphodiesterase [Anaerococcus porci]MSS78126.1 phosphodiesterase [Anaerococcus porci]NVF12070.1 phosphodiesterase [Anaerococcus faecalis]
MKIGVISDTHGSLFYTKKALEKLGKCDKIIHLGDVLYHGPRNPVHETYKPKELAEFLKRLDIIYIRGNCDSDVDCMVTEADIYTKERFLDFGEVKIYAVHGYEESLDERVKRAKEFGADTLLFGHSHIKVMDNIDGINVINPGSTTLPKDGTNSCAVYQDGKWEFIEL